MIWRPPFLHLFGTLLDATLFATFIRLAQLAGAFLLLMSPGYWGWRLLGFHSSLRSPFTWAAAFLTSLVIVPLTLNVASIAFGFLPITVIATLLALSIALATLVHWRKPPAEPLWREEAPWWVLSLLIGLSGIIAAWVIASYIPIKTPDGLPWVIMGDWSKHGALIWTLASSGVPPEDIFLGSPPAHILTYYYFFHLWAAVLHLLTGQSLDLRWAFMLPAAGLAFSFPVLLYGLGCALFRRARAALLTTYFVVLVGGLDLIAVGIVLRQQNAPIFQLSSWIKFPHIDAWAPPRGLLINLFYAYFIWTPHHLAALALLLMGWFLWMRRPQWRALRFWAPLISASMIGFSVYLTIVAAAGIGGWLIWEAALSLKRRDADNLKQWKTWALRGLWLWAITAILALPMLWIYWQGRTPGRGVIFAAPTSAVVKLWPQLAQLPPWLQPFLYFLQYFFDFGVGLALLALGVILTILAYVSSSWRTHQPAASSILRTSAWRWIFSTGVIALLLVTLFESAGAAADANAYVTLNDFGMRVIMPAQILAGLMAPIALIWARNLRWRWDAMLLAAVAVLLVAPGILATGWEMTSMALAKYRLAWTISNPELQALAFVRNETPRDIHFQLSPDQLSEKYLIARRRPVLWGRTAPLISSDQPRAHQLLHDFNEAFHTEDANRSAQLFAENGVDLIFVTSAERTPAMHPKKYQDAERFRLVFDNGWVQMYQVGDKPAISPRITLPARALRARQGGDIERARKLYAQAVEAEPDPGLRKDILMQWAIMERFEDPQTAVDLFRQVLALEPGDVEAHANLGAALLGLGQVDDAISVLTFVVRRDRGHYWGWRMLAEAHERQGHLKHALDAYRHAVEAVSDPDSKAASVAVMGMIRSAAYLGRCEQAFAISQQYESLLQEQSENPASALKPCR